MILTDLEKAMGNGDYGSGIRKCMDILIKFGEAFGADRMVPLSSAHTMPKEPPELLQEMTEGVRQTGVFTSLHSLMSAFSPRSWKQMGIPEAFAAKELCDYEERESIYGQAGFYQTYTCLPMLTGNLPLKGQFISWIGTGAQLLSNSLMGARCNRDGTIINLASAIVGRAPYRGLFLDENRHAEVLVTLEGVDPATLTYAQLGAVGYHVGAKAEDRNIVMGNLPDHLDLTQLKYLMAPLSVSGSVSICHIAGLTPEAPTIETALNRRKPSEVIIVGPNHIRDALSQYEGDLNHVDMAIFGCPHCTVSEVKLLASFLEGKKISGAKRLWLGMPYPLYYLAQQMGYVRMVEDAGGVFASSCMAMIPDAPIPEGVKTIATNSFKAAHYISRLTKGAVKVIIGDMEACVHAVIGR
ncbi:MAG: aconitase X catalytic domain-containing protein [Deltaproteobacteria bacterium]|nr:aconitase X catalytic domain-containing protein [Deltaproteobacteria bacterium]